MNVRLFFVTAVIAAILLTAAVKTIFGQPAQPPPDPAFLQKALSVVQAQRNAAQDRAASIEAQAALLIEENAKLKSELDELKKKQAPP